LIDHARESATTGETRAGLPERPMELGTRMERSDSLTHVVILGSTGSIGRSALSVVEHDGGAHLKVHGLSAHASWKLMAEQATRHRPRFVVMGDSDRAALASAELRGTGVEVLAGLDGIIRMVQDPRTDRVLSAVVGAVGLRGTWAALEAGKIVALANKSG
jgi:1-deoxy-D-xylulose-5-phosphate reductoisomerase